MENKKQILRKDLVEVLSLTREHYHGDGLDDANLRRRIEACIRIENCGGPGWLKIVDFVDALLGYKGIWREATNWDIFELLEKLGWKIVDRVEESHEAEETL